MPDRIPAMTIPHVIETPLRLEPVTADTFADPTVPRPQPVSAAPIRR